MAWKKTVTLKDGRKVLLRDLSRKDSAKEMRDFIAQFVREGAYVTMEKVPTLAEERKWLRKTLKEVGKGTKMQIIAESNGEIVGSIEARRGEGQGRGNVSLGITLSKPFRNAGLGRIALAELIRRAKKRLKPVNIYLVVYAPNKPAQALYKKLGFKELAHFPRWARHRGKHIDMLYMLLSE